jgi:hypothetical protein
MQQEALEARRTLVQTRLAFRAVHEEVTLMIAKAELMSARVLDFRLLRPDNR